MPGKQLNVPKAQMDCLARTLIDAAKRFFDDPENMREYQEWLKTPEGQKCLAIERKLQNGGMANEMV